MHQTRAQSSTRLPIPRKGTKYLARARGSLKESVSVVTAIRDILKLARTTKEVKHMIHEKQLKINNKEVKDIHESIKLFNILQADKTYQLLILPTGRFIFKETKEKDRICKVINKNLLKNNQTQLNLHDGSNILTKDKINTNDTTYLSPENKITKTVKLEKGAECFISSGKYAGNKGKIENLENGTVKVKLDDKTVELNKENIIAL